MKTKTLKKALSLFLAVLMIALAIPFTLLTVAAEEPTEVDITSFSAYGRYSSDTEKRENSESYDKKDIWFQTYDGETTKRAFDKKIGTEAQTKGYPDSVYEMCYFEDGVMKNGENPDENGKSYYGIFIVELTDDTAVDTLSLWAIDNYGEGWMSNNAYDIWYSVDGSSYTMSAEIENASNKSSHETGTYYGVEGYVRNIDMNGVTAKYIAIAVSEYAPAQDNAERKEMIFYEIVVMGTSPKLMLEDGARVRKTAPTGLRFTGYANKSYVDGLKTETNEVTLGMLITPTDYLAKVDAFTKADLDACTTIQNEYKYLEIDATTVLTDGDDYKINCTIVNILEANYDREFSAILYVKVTEGETTEYIYSSYSKVRNSRSVAYIASLALSDVQDTQDEEYKYPVTVYGETKYSPYDENEIKTLEGFSKVASPITVMTYNIKRYDAPDGVGEEILGGNAEWDGRDVAKAMDTITTVSPDVLGLQEDNTYLDEYTETLLGTYTRLYENGNDDENNAIFYKTAKFTLVASKTVSYESIKDSYSSNSAVSAADFTRDDEGRFFRYAVLKDENGTCYLIVNTHLHNGNDEADKNLRKAQSTLLKLWLLNDATAKQYSNQIVMGDMNGVDDAREMTAITSGEGALSFAKKNAIYKGDVGATLTNDAYTERGSMTIDHILYGNSDMVAVEYTVIDNKVDQNGTAYPSDHLPVLAKFICISK